MKKVFSISAIALSLCFASSCKKDEGKQPDISFKTGTTYVSADATIAAGSDFAIGINAAKTESEDVLKQFDISKSVNETASASVFNKNLSGAEADNFTYDFVSKADTTVGSKSKYTFTITNRDGLTNQVSLTLTTK